MVAAIRVFLLPGVLFLLVLLAPRPGSAEWPADSLVNVPLCTAEGAQVVRGIASDGAGGAIVAWSGKGGGRAQHVLASGDVDSAWPADGRGVCDSCEVYEMVSDGAGGVIVPWTNRRGGGDGVFVQHVPASGAADPAWPADGLSLCTIASYKTHLMIATDGAGGAVVVWTDDRHHATGKRHEGFRHLYAQHVLASGDVDPTWPPDGRAVFAPTSAKGTPTLRLLPDAKVAIVADGAGGVIVAWESGGGGYRKDEPALYAQHVLARGNLDSGWPADGLRLCDPAKGEVEPAIVADGAGGAIVTWKDLRRGLWHSDIYAQHVLASGKADPGWPGNGRGLCDAPQIQEIPRIVSDGAGGAIVCWRDDRAMRVEGRQQSMFGLGAIYAQHLLASGEVDSLWPRNGLALFARDDRQGTPRMIGDGGGGAIVVWEEVSQPGNAPPASSFLTTTGCIRAQHALPTGGLDPAWPAGGRALCVVPYQLSRPHVVADGAGGAILAFMDRRAPVATGDGGHILEASDIFAKRVRPNGQLGGSVVAPR